MTALLLTMEADEKIRYVRFGRPLIPQFDRNIRPYNKSGRFGIDLVENGNALDSNHVVQSDYYRDCLGSLNDPDYDFRVPEDIFYSESVCDSKAYLYGNIKEYGVHMNDRTTYVGHLDGRNVN